MFYIYLILIRPLYYLSIGATVKLKSNKLSKKKKKMVVGSSPVVVT